MAQDMHAAVTAAHLEIAVVRIKPAIQLFGNLDFTFAEIEPPGRFFALVTAIAFHTHTDHVSIIANAHWSGERCRRRETIRQSVTGFEWVTGHP